MLVVAKCCWWSLVASDCYKLMAVLNGWGCSELMMAVGGWRLL